MARTALFQGANTGSIPVGAAKIINMTENITNSQESNKESKQLTEKEINEFYWRAAEYNLKKKDINWYISLFLISLILIIFAILQKNFLFIIFILLTTSFLIYLNRTKPRILDFKVDSLGVNIGQELFLKYEDLEGFGFYEKQDSLDELVLKTKKGISHYFFIPIDKTSKDKVKEILIKKIPEFQYEPSLIDLMFDRFF